MEHLLQNRMYFAPPCAIQPVDSDGNCQWKALSWACFGTDQKYAQIRHRVCNEIKNNWQHYKGFILDSDSYLQKMSKDGTWGDHCTLNAFCNVYEQHVLVLDARNESPMMLEPTRNKNNVKASQWVVIVYDHIKMHYSSVHPYYASPTSLFLRKLKSHHLP